MDLLEMANSHRLAAYYKFMFNGASRSLVSALAGQRITDVWILRYDCRFPQL